MSNNKELYRKLQQDIDRMPVGFPASDSGVEIRILEKLFSPEEARLALELSALPETLKTIHRRVKKTGITLQELEKKLDGMLKKGIIMGGKMLAKKGDDRKYYSKAGFAIGFYEFQVNKFTKELKQDCEEYMNSTFYKEFNRTDRLRQMRTIPIGTSLPSERTVAVYDDVRRIVTDAPLPICLLNCVCRQGKELIEKKCTRTDVMETCMTFGNAAAFIIEAGDGKEISRNEALALLNKFEDIGLILQPQNTKNPLVICACCGCCCGVLQMLKKFPRPADFYASNYYAQVNQELCKGCKICEKRCNMQAIKVTDKKARVDLDRCIGCGVCVPTCKSLALSLAKKEKEIIPPLDQDALYQKIAVQKVGIPGVAKMVGKMVLGLKA